MQRSLNASKEDISGFQFWCPFFQPHLTSFYFIFFMGKIFLAFQPKGPSSPSPKDAWASSREGQRSVQMGLKEPVGPNFTNRHGCSQLENKGQFLRRAFLRTCLPLTFKYSLFTKWGLFVSQGQRVFHKSAFSIRFSLCHHLYKHTWNWSLLFSLHYQFFLSLLPFKVLS